MIKKSAAWRLSFPHISFRIRFLAGEKRRIDHVFHPGQLQLLSEVSKLTFFSSIAVWERLSGFSKAWIYHLVSKTRNIFCVLASKHLEESKLWQPPSQACKSQASRTCQQSEIYYTCRVFISGICKTGCFQTHPLDPFAPHQDFKRTHSSVNASGCYSIGSRHHLNLKSP